MVKACPIRKDDPLKAKSRTLRCFILVLATVQTVAMVVLGLSHAQTGTVQPDNCRVSVENARALEGPIGAVDAKTVRFTQDSIGGKFKIGVSLTDTIAALQRGEISPKDFPPIRIFLIEDKLFSLDNRRLYVFQQTGDKVATIPASLEEIENETFKFTTRNCGISIRVRKIKD